MSLYIYCIVYLFAYRKELLYNDSSHLSVKASLDSELMKIHGLELCKI